uniref:Protein FAM221B n=1 Tax=Jaculus jaculus TaxID=51337 RepID=A0A8C5P2H1_JACJA
MEADEVTEEPQTNMNAKEHPSSKDPTAEDQQEPSIPETLQEPSQHASEPQFETSTFLIPEIQASEGHLRPSVFETPLEPFELSLPSLSVGSLKVSIPENPWEFTTSETQISNVPRESFPFQPLPGNNISESPHVSLRELFVAEISSNEIPQTQDPKFEYLPKDSLSGPSAQVHMDTYTKQEEKTGKDNQKVDTSEITTHTALPEPHLSKKGKKRKAGTGPSSPFPDRASHPEVLAKQAELVEMAKAMHREQFRAPSNNLFQWEKQAALKAIQTGLYIGWRCPHYLWDCFQIGNKSKCFCGHLLKQHQIASDISVPCSVSQCRCLMFCFIPSRPEEVGEFWLKRRSTFNPIAWRAQCRCKHSHEEHAATGAHPCRHRGCCCSFFESNFLCAACDRRWEEHETFFETEETRRRGGRTYTINNWRRPF